jgi:hypothetical protein
MRKASTLIGLMLFALGASARAQEPAPGSPTPPPAVVVVPVVPVAAPAPTVVQPAERPAEFPRRRLELGVAFIPIGVGSITTSGGASTITSDALFAYGVGLSVSYRVFAGLTLGLAPQAIFNVGYKPEGGAAAAPAGKEYDLLARIAYLLPLAESIAVYGELLPGYSKLSGVGSGAPNGLVLAFDVGVQMGLSDRLFVNIGGGYQWGFQKVSIMGMKYDNNVDFVRAQIAVGTRF